MTESPERRIRKRLQEVRYPGLDRDIVSFGFIRDIWFEDGRVRVSFRPSTDDPDKLTRMEDQIAEAVSSCDDVESVVVRTKPIDGDENSRTTSSDEGSTSSLDSKAGSEDQVTQRKIPGVDHVIAVISGKGGVGKSTVAVNLAEALSRQSLDVGLADLDIYGPSAPTMFGIRGQPEVDEDDRIIPLKSRGISVMSIGFVLGDSEPSIWRGPMVMQAVEEFLHKVQWGEQDVLIADLPPGTGDAQLSLMQTVSLDGAIVVTTPQILALLDVDRSVEMCKEMGTDILGIVENMSYFVCDDCGKEHHVFGKGGGKEMARRLNLPYLGGLPLQPEVREGGDRGQPIFQQDPSSEITGQFEQIAKHVIGELSLNSGND